MWAARVAITKCGALFFDDCLMFARCAYFGRFLEHGPYCLIAALDILANSRNLCVSLVRKDFCVIFDLRGAAFGLPDSSLDFIAALDFVALDQRR